MYTINKDQTVSKVKAEVKANVTEFILECLKEKYGADSVAMVRTGGTTKTNEIGFIVDTAENEGETNPICVTLNPTVKEFANRKTTKREYTAFDFGAAALAYENYLYEKEAKADEAARAKEKKIAKDKAAREAKAKEQNEEVED